MSIGVGVPYEMADSFGLERGAVCEQPLSPEGPPEGLCVEEGKDRVSRKGETARWGLRAGRSSFLLSAEWGGEAA